MIIKWAGSKRRIINTLLEHVPSFSSRYYEPFFGAGHLFFALKPQKAFLSDSNLALMLMWESVQSEPEVLCYKLKQLQERYETLTPGASQKRFYYAQRVRFNIFHPPESLIFLNKVGFNGLYRVNAKGQYNVPIGKRANGEHNPFTFSEDDIMSCHEAFCRGNIGLDIQDYEAVLSKLGKNDFGYLDPPYVDPAAGNFTGYTSGRFSFDDYINIKNIMLELSGKVMLSCPDTDWMRSTFAPFNIVSLQAPRSISRDGNGRGKVGELLVKNYE